MPLNWDENEFPLYTHFLESGGQVHLTDGQVDLAQACYGSDDDKFAFLDMVHGLAFDLPLSFVPGATPEMKEQTLRDCREGYAELALRGHKGARHMLAFYDESHIGAPLDPAISLAPVIVIREEDFPLYTILVDENQRGVDTLRKAFNAAASGADDYKFAFAVGIHSVAVGLPEGALPEATDEVIQKTLRSCRAVFENLAVRGHGDAAGMLDHYNENRLGLPPAQEIPKAARLRRGKYSM